ncbi:MAG: DNA repair exonuclease [Pseudomonadota bacterium]
MAFSFIHTGDLHLDSPLAGLAKHEDERARTVSAASRRAFSALCDEAIARAVDAFLIAGDLWDGEWRDVDVAHFVQQQAGRLRGAGIPVLAILGNHDAQSRMRDRLRALDAVHFFPSGTPTSVEVGPATVHGVSFDRPAVSENLALKFPPAIPGRFNIGLLHTSLNGDVQGTYAPCRPADLDAKGYDYWALGHVHTRAIMGDVRPASRGGTAAYCGVLQGRHVRETGRKGAYAVTLSEGAAPHLDEIDVAPVGWQDLAVDVSGGEAIASVRAALEGLAGELTEDLGMVRVRLTGTSADHFRHHARSAELAREVGVMAAGLAAGRIVIEDVRVETRPPSDAPPPLPAHFEAVLLEAAGDDDLAAGLAPDLQDILNEASLGTTPQALRELLPGLGDFEDRADLKRLLADAAADVAAKLSEGEG